MTPICAGPPCTSCSACTNRQGLTSLLLADKPDVASFIQATNVPGLYLLSSGPQPPNPAELLASKKMEETVVLLAKAFEAVLYDSPPVLAVADASILAAKVRAVVMIVDSGRTRTDVAQRAKAAIDNTGADLPGCGAQPAHDAPQRLRLLLLLYQSADGDLSKRKKSRRGLLGGLRRRKSPAARTPEPPSNGNGKHKEQQEAEVLQEPALWSEQPAQAPEQETGNG